MIKLFLLKVSGTTVDTVQGPMFVSGLTFKIL